MLRERILRAGGYVAAADSPTGEVSGFYCSKACAGVCVTEIIESRLYLVVRYG